MLCLLLISLPSGGHPMKHYWLPHELEACWSLAADEEALLAGESMGSCTRSLRINTAGSSINHFRIKKFSMRGLSWHPSSPVPLMTPSKSAVRTHDPVSTHVNLSLPLLLSLPHASADCGHGGTRKSKTSRRVHTRSVSPAAIAGVRGRHVLAEPVPLVGRGCGNGTRRLAWGKQKL
jgi:hypothetical protein